MFGLKHLSVLAIAVLLVACGEKKQVASTPTAPKAPATTTAGQPMPRPVTPPPVAPPSGVLTKKVKITNDEISLWSDEYLYAGWRIQRHFYDSKSRLLDNQNHLRALGNYTQVKQAFDYLRWQEKVQPKSRKLALVLHGLASNPSVWNDMRIALAKDGWEARTVTYPTTEQGVAPNGDVLENLLRNQEGYGEIAIVAHSLGGLVTRVALSRPSFETLPVPITKVVMLGTPNQGATLAAMLRPVARAAVTASANDLLPERARQFGTIPAKVQFGVIAGGRNNSVGYNPLLAGDNDSIVKVTETRTANMDDFIVLPVLHNGMTSEPQVIEAVRRFLKNGSFRTMSTKPVG
jgi:pimeloyl-ACP methyl ester carboxylesterase